MIQNSVGKGRVSKPVDVITLQLLLNDVSIYKTESSSDKEYTLLQSDNAVILPELAIDGCNPSDLTKRIEAYQIACDMKIVDGWIGPKGSTIASLIQTLKVNSALGRMNFIRNKIKSKKVSIIKPQKIASCYQKQYGSLGADSKDGLDYILTTAKSDSDLESIKELSYMLATTKHETAHTFLGIEEYGKGAGRSYGKDISVTDPLTNKTYPNKYYGRGYVQLTWGYNYQRLDEKLGNGIYPHKNKIKPEDFNKGFTIKNSANSIYLNPEKALEKENAYVGLVWGMQQGIYTGRKVGDYISAGKSDYKNARRVINGQDQATAIAEYAENFEIMLLASTI